MCRQTVFLYSYVASQRTERPPPLTCTPIRFGLWMGGDRDGNPNETAKHTSHCYKYNGHNGDREGRREDADREIVPPLQPLDPI